MVKKQPDSSQVADQVVSFLNLNAYEGRGGGASFFPQVHFYYS